jgi:predicted nucleic acid binding AN1-type Zn finger protein
MVFTYSKLVIVTEQKMEEIMQELLIQQQRQQTRVSVAIKNACIVCKRRITLAEIYKCKCNQTHFCSKHRFYPNHNCAFIDTNCRTAMLQPIVPQKVLKI